MLIRILVCACTFFGALIFGIMYIPWLNRILFSVNGFGITGNLVIACGLLCMAYSVQGKGGK